MTQPIKTPSEMRAAQRCDSGVGAHPCQSVIPFYPLRYAVRPATGSGYDFAHPNLRSDFPELGDVSYVLRLLRPESWLYLYDENNRQKLVCFVYRAQEDGDRRPHYFFRVDLDPETGEHSLLPQTLSHPYVPAYDPQNPPQVIQVLVTDAPLSNAMALTLKSDAALRESAMQKIDLQPWLEAFKVADEAVAVPATPAVKDTLSIMEMQQQVLEVRGRRDDWSEHRTSWKAGALQIYDTAMKLQSAGMLNGVRLAIALNDPIGVQSELNRLLDDAQRRINEFHVRTARPLRSAVMVELLAEKAQVKGESAGKLERMQWEARLGRDPNDKRVEQRGEEYRRTRLIDVRDTERNEFLRQYDTDLKDHTARLELAAQRAADWHNGQRKAMEAAMELYDPKDDIGQRALRVALARTLDFCMVHTPTAQALAEQLQEEGPSGVFRGLTAHATVAAWLNASKAIEFSGDKLASTHLDKLREVQARLPVDAASQRVSLIMGVILSRERKYTPAQYWKSPYPVLMQALEGNAVAAKALSDPKQISQWLESERRQVTLAHSRGQAASPRPDRLLPATARNPPSRPTALHQALSESLQIRYEESVLAAANDDMTRIAREEMRGRQSLGWKLPLWHNVKTGFGGLGLWVSLSNVGEALTKLSKADAQWAVEGMGLTGDLLAVGASGSLLTQTAYEWKKDMAGLRGNAEVAAKSLARAQVAERFAIGLAGAAALAYSVRDGYSAYQDWEKDNKAAGITMVGAGVQFTAAGLAGSWTIGKMWPSTMRVGIGAAARLGVGPIGWGLFALEMTYHAISAWRSWYIEEKQLNTWLSRCYWGVGKRSGTNTRSVTGTLLFDVVGHYADDAEEVHAFFSLSHKPRIETSFIASGIVLGGLLPGELGERPGKREVAITFSGWRQDISRYRVHFYPNSDKTGTPVVHEGDMRMTLVAGAGVLKLESTTLNGAIEVTWWPGGAAGYNGLSYTADY